MQNYMLWEPWELVIVRASYRRMRPDDDFNRWIRERLPHRTVAACRIKRRAVRNGRKPSALAYGLAMLRARFGAEPKRAIGGRAGPLRTWTPADDRILIRCARAKPHWYRDALRRLPHRTPGALKRRAYWLRKQGKL